MGQLIHTEVQKIDTVPEWQIWLAKARPGAACQYCEGYLARFYTKLGSEAWQAYESGIVDLVQKKIDDGEYLYFAIIRHKRGKNAK